MFDAVLLDCDGTLVDSEHASNMGLSLFLKSYGLDYTPEELTNRFMGWSNDRIVETVGEETGVPFPGDVLDALVGFFEHADREHLRQIEGASLFLQNLGDMKRAVVSNGDLVNIHRRLRVAGLMDHLDPALCFGREDVVVGKPAPDLYLKAAGILKADITKCLVLEDSVTGAQSGVAAGAVVWGFTGAAHDPDEREAALKSCGARLVFKDFQSLTNAYEQRLGRRWQ